MIQEIQNLYAEVDKKTEFIKDVANDLGKSPLTLRHHWFGQFWAIPEEHQPRVKQLLTLTIESQKATA